MGVHGKGAGTEHTLMLSFNKLAQECPWARPSWDPEETDGFTGCLRQHELSRHRSGVRLGPLVQPHCAGSRCQVGVTPVFSCYFLGILCACFHC